MVCNEGCAYSYVLDVAGNFYSPTGNVCTVDDAPPPQPDRDHDGVPDDLDAFPDDPNESADSDGDGIGDNADFAPNDPTNGDDKSAPGEDNGERDNIATGGGDCTAPPQCSGDGIQCAQLYQLWRLNCKSASVTGDPTACSGSYSCSGDSLQCAQVALLRKNACQGVTAGDGSFGTADKANLQGIADGLRGEGTPDTGPGDEEPGDAFMDSPDPGEEPDSFDQSGYGFTRSCPSIPAINVFGTAIEFDIEPLCDWATLGGYIVVALAGLACVRIISGRAA